MKTIIAGSRGITDYDIVLDAMRLARQKKIVPTVVVSGAARGVDKLGERWGHERGLEVVQFPAIWKMFGKGAGRVRNAQMARYSDALVAVWDGQSRGTKHMIEVARLQGLHLYVYIVG